MRKRTDVFFVAVALATLAGGCASWVPWTSKGDFKKHLNDFEKHLNKFKVLQSRVGANTADMGKVRSQMTKLDGEAKTLSGSVGKLQNVADANAVLVKNLKDDLAAANARISTNTAGLTEAADERSRLSGRLDGADKSIAALEETGRKLGEDLGKLAEDVKTQKEGLMAAMEWLKRHDDSLRAHDGRLGKTEEMLDTVGKVIQRVNKNFVENLEAQLMMAQSRVEQIEELIRRFKSKREDVGAGAGTTGPGPGTTGPAPPGGE
jgi:chromosome segregation ATPase